MDYTHHTRLNTAKLADILTWLGLILMLINSLLLDNLPLVDVVAVSSLIGGIAVRFLKGNSTERKEITKKIALTVFGVMLVFVYLYFKYIQ